MERVSILFVFLCLLTVTSCNQGSREQADTVNLTIDDSEVESTTTDVIPVDKDVSTKTMHELSAINEQTPRLTKDSPDYLNSLNEMKSIDKQRKRLIETINKKHSHYLGYLLSDYSSYDLHQSSHNLIKAVMREERYSYGY